MRPLAARKRPCSRARSGPRLIDLLDLVALGTAVDFAPLKGLNRAFVIQRLKVMAQRRNIGLATLFEAAA